jgi:hypothetical protein
LVENGVLVSKQANQGRPICVDDICDGTSQTLLATESREQNIASWFDGQATWVTALRMDVLPGPDDKFEEDRAGYPIVAAGSTALNVENRLELPPLTGNYVRRWGPSSEHDGGVVNHVFVDGHVVAMLEDIDSYIYLTLTTRDGAEGPPPITPLPRH